MYQIYYLTLKKIFPKITTFDSKKNYFKKGRDETNNLLLNKIKNENPDLIIFALDNEEIKVETFFELRRNYPQIKKTILICDDDSRFETWSRYYALFFDLIIQSPPMQKNYLNEGIPYSAFHFDYNTYKLEPMNIEKKYDISFIGRPKADRVEIARFLKKNGIKIALFGWGWHEYSDLKDIYYGPLDQADYTKVINQSKINLNFTKAGFSEEQQHFNMKGRFFEVALCKAFQLIEYYPGLEQFFKDKYDVGYYRDNNDLLNKIKYYLKNEKEREKIAEQSYKTVITKFNREKDLIKKFSDLFGGKIKGILLPEYSKRIFTIDKKNLFSNREKLAKNLDNYDFVDFSIGKHKKFGYKVFFQVHSLEKTSKPISCCDYFVSNSVKNYLLFSSYFTFKRIPEKANLLINLNQLLVKKEFFLENIERFRRIYYKKERSLLNEKNTALVSIPLVSLSNIPNLLSYEDMEKGFEMKFMADLFRLKMNNNIFFNSYPYKLVMRALLSENFILKYLMDKIKSKSTKDQINLNKYLFN